jgi:transmembrane 9 superfamily protein 2/4
LCEVASPLTAEQLEKLKEYIKQDYRVEWIVDDLPSATAIINLNQYEPGFHLGLYSESTGLAYVNNYFDIRIRYQKNPRDEKEAYILGFEVVPRSIDWKTAGGVCDPKPLGDVNYKQAVVGKDLGKISYSYSLRWIEDPNVSWSKRWEMYMDSSDPQIHWYSIINSTMLLTLLSIIVAFILLATLRKDIAMYNEENGVVRLFQC